MRSSIRLPATWRVRYRGLVPAAADIGRRDEPRPGVPLGRVGGAHEMAAVVAFLCSDEASYVTGASFVADGGMTQMGPMAGSHLGSDDWRDG